MALRLLQIYMPENVGPDLTPLLQGHQILGVWRDAERAERVVINLLAPAEETEIIMDKLGEAFEGVPDLRMVLSPVEASLPRPQNDEPANAVQAARLAERHGLLRVSREELYQEVEESLGVNRVYLAMTVLASLVAAVGLQRNDVAVVIGAMIIAPLLGPNVAMAFATTLGDFKLLRRALVTNFAGIGLAVLVSIIVGVFFPVDPSGPAILARTHVSLGDLVLGLAAGSAGTYAFTRGTPGAVIGVMVAVALMPPLVVLGMLLGAGLHPLAFNAALLVAANIICINLAGVATLLLQGVGPRSWWEADRARRATRLAIATWIGLLAALAAIVVLFNL